MQIPLNSYKIPLEPGLEKKSLNIYLMQIYSTSDISN